MNADILPSKLRSFKVFLKKTNLLMLLHCRQLNKFVNYHLKLYGCPPVNDFLKRQGNRLKVE